MTIAFFPARRSRPFRPAAAQGPESDAQPKPMVPAPANDSTPPAVPLRFRILKAAGWSMIGYVGVQVLRMASSLILTRLLVPEMFGVMAAATMVQVSVAMLSDLGLRPAAIQSSMGDNQDYLDTAWTVQLLHGCFIWAACLFIAVLIGQGNAFGWFSAHSVYADPALPAVIVATSFTAVIVGLQSTRLVTAYRHLQLGPITMIELGVQVVSLLIAVPLALYTPSIWVFVLSTLGSSAAFTIATHLYLPGGRNRFRLEPAALHDLLRIGKWILLSSIFTVLAANGDRILLAGWTDPVTLGLYALALNFIMMLEGVGNRLFSSVALPALSSVYREQPERLGEAFYRLRLPFDLVFVTAAGAFFAFGPTLIDILYDGRYGGAGQILQIFSFSLLVTRFQVLASVCLATGEPKTLTLMNMARSIAMFSLVPLAYWVFGFQGALWAVALHGVPSLLLVFLYNSRHKLTYPVHEVLVLLAWPLGYGLGWAGGLLARMLSLSA